jgi:hypothetical protein
MQKERQNLHSGKHNSFAFPVVQACTSHRVASTHPRRGSMHCSRSCQRTVRRVAACLAVEAARSRCRRRERIDPERRPSGHQGHASTCRRRGRVDREHCPYGHQGYRSSIRHRQSSIRPPWPSFGDGGDGDGGAWETSVVRCSTSHKKWCYGLDPMTWSSRGSGSL